MQMVLKIENRAAQNMVEKDLKVKNKIRCHEEVNQREF
jgi:hypothetical protein